MGWKPQEMADERAFLQSFAAYKYDEYQQFLPGRHFLESLARWLGQFETEEERGIAYDFVKNRLVFVSDAEMNHLVELSFPIHVRPHLIRKTAAQIGVCPRRVKFVTKSPEYKVNLRQTLFLGLTDGARTDRFRRANALDISNEQIWHSYEVSDSKAIDLNTKLQNDLARLKAPQEAVATPKFGTVVLLDDFTGSGTSYIRQMDGGLLDGKIPRILHMLEHRKALADLIAPDGVEVIVVIYVAAPQAIHHIETLVPEIKFSRGTVQFEVVHRLSEDTKLSEFHDEAILNIAKADTYFDAEADHENDTIDRLGYAKCQLPIVLSHNTPNNSIYLLWAEDTHKVDGLFPRVSRHRKFE